MTKVLRTPIRFQRVSYEDDGKQLLGHGASQAMADGLAQLFRAIDAGLYDSEPRTAESTTPTSFEQWCTDTSKPAFAG